MIRYIQSLIRLPTPESLAHAELQTARRELLSAQTARDYATAIVKYNEDRVARLNRTIAAATHNTHTTPYHDQIQNHR